MSRNYYSEINLHLVWHTKNNLPLLTPRVEPIVDGLLRQRIIDTPGAFVHECGGIENHVHLAVTIPPALTISEWIGQLKGGSSHDLNEQLGGKTLQWQVGYGVVSFGTGDLPWVCSYVRKQHAHHSSQQVHDRLERITQFDDSQKAESTVGAQREGP
jgi:putative transposase